jgi:hypothetical protein
MNMNRQQPLVSWYEICIWVFNIPVKILSKVRKNIHQRGIKKWCLSLAYKLEEWFYWRVHGSMQLLPLMDNTKHKHVPNQCLLWHASLNIKWPSSPCKVKSSHWLTPKAHAAPLALYPIDLFCTFLLGTTNWPTLWWWPGCRVKAEGPFL